MYRNYYTQKDGRVRKLRGLTDPPLGEGQWLRCRSGQYRRALATQRNCPLQVLQSAVSALRPSPYRGGKIVRDKAAALHRTPCPLLSN